MMSFLIWAGTALAVTGALGLLFTLRPLGPRSRRRGLALAFAGIACVALGFALPGAEARTANTRQLIDAFVPTDHFHETHWERIRATPREIFTAIHAVRPNEVRGFVPILWAHSPGMRRPSDALMRRPILEVMRGQHFVVLAEQPGREIVVGTIGQYWANRTVPLRTANQFRNFKDPRYAKVAMNVRVRDEGNGWCKVTTETRVLCTDMHARRKFDAYWRVVYPGSALLRGQWLAAIKRRAERPTGLQSPGVGDARIRRRDRPVTSSSAAEDLATLPKSAPGKANLTMSTNQLAERFGAVAMTLEMPFKDHDTNPDPVHGWSPDRCRKLAHSCLEVLAQQIDGY